MSRSHMQSGISIVLFDKLRSSADELEHALTRRNEIVNKYKKVLGIRDGAYIECNTECYLSGWRYRSISIDQLAGPNSKHLGR